ncbi:MULTISPECIES: GpE family phage tail protein [Bartonella]|nr:GpE family phage tail protein [Bartonella grahamii]
MELEELVFWRNQAAERYKTK